VRPFSLSKFPILFVGLYSTVAAAQTAPLIGRVQEAVGGQPIPDANIGIRGRNVGTAADERGQFQLSVPAALRDDSLTVSAVGYQTRTWAVSALAAAPAPLRLALTEKKAALPEVAVVGRASKLRRLGTTSHSSFVVGQVTPFNQPTDIVEFAKLISVDKKPTRLLSAHIYLVGHAYQRADVSDSVTLRLNFYRVVPAGGLPGERLVERSVIVRNPLRIGWLTIDLDPYALILADDFYLGYEFLPHQRQPIPRFLYGGQFGGSAVKRTSSLGTWSRSVGARLSAYVTVRQ